MIQLSGFHYIRIPTCQITDPVYLIPFLLVLVLMFVQQFGGVDVISFYVQAIFASTGTSMDKGTLLLITTTF